MEIVYVQATEGMSPAQVLNFQTFLDAIAKDCGWDGKFIVRRPASFQTNIRQ